MCGIIGYYSDSPSNAGKIVVEGLKKMEYRGYDSWGFAIKTKEKIEVEKDIGPVSCVDIGGGKLCCHAIGHTRWATHGKVTKQNAHPHLSCDGNVCIVHNGIIENYYDLKKQLEKKNYVFQSDTDTEVIPHLIQEYMKETNDFKESIKKACQCLEGRYAFIAICNDFDGLIGIKKGSPLIIGHGKTNSFITSDVVAFAEHTKKVTYLDDDEMVIIK